MRVLPTRKPNLFNPKTQTVFGKKGNSYLLKLLNNQKSSVSFPLLVNLETASAKQKQTLEKTDMDWVRETYSWGFLSLARQWGSGTLSKGKIDVLSLMRMAICII